MKKIIPILLAVIVCIGLVVFLASPAGLRTDPTTAPTISTTTPIGSTPIAPTDSIPSSTPSTIPDEPIDSYEALAALGISLTAFEYNLDTYICILVLTWTNDTETAAMLTDYFDIYLTQDDVRLIDCSIADAPVEPNETAPIEFRFEMMNENPILVHVVPKDGNEIVIEFNLNAVG